MQLTNLSKNILTDISIYRCKLTEDIFKDFAFIDLMNKLLQSKVNHNHKFAIYTDLSLISTQTLIPIFHTMYLGSSSHNVIIEDSNDLWLTQTFKNNKYYIIPKIKDDFNYDPYPVTKIQTIKEIL